MVYLVTIFDTRQKDQKLEGIPMMNEYLDIFLEELLGLPPNKEIEFAIELVPNTAPTSKAPYRIVPTKLKELKEQLQDHLDKVFIRPSVFLFGVLDFR